MNQLYFVCASALFLISCYQVDLSSKVLQKNESRTASLMAQAFEAGCVVTKGHGCQKAANQYAQELSKIF